MVWTEENKLAGVIPLPEADYFHELGHRARPTRSETAAHHVSVHMPLNSRGSLVEAVCTTALISSPQLLTESRQS